MQGHETDWLMQCDLQDSAGRSSAAKYGAALSQIPLDRLTAEQVHALAVAHPPVRTTRNWQVIKCRARPAYLHP